MTVVVVGSLNVDLVVGLARMPEAGETVFGHSLDRFPGGKGLNQAVAAARAGARVVMVGAVGMDDAGPWLRSQVAQEGIDDAHLHAVNGPSGTAVIEVDESGMNRIVVIAGANAAVDSQAVEQALAAINEITVVLVQHEVPAESVRAAMRAGRARGAVTILNPAPAREIDADTLAHVDLIVPNEHEAALLTGLSTATAEQAGAAAARLRDLGAAGAIITRGAEAVIWSDAEGTGTADAFPVVAVDTVAAGDAFCGALAAGLAEGRPLTEAIRMGCAAGGLAASARGAVPSLPYRAAIDALVDAG